MNSVLVLSAVLLHASHPSSDGVPAGIEPAAAVRATRPQESFAWRPAIRESMTFLALEHGFRLAVQPQTRRSLRGPFFRDYVDSLKSHRGWRDGDPWIINYVGHPMQGAITGFIQIQNDPRGRRLEFANSREYWNSRLRALAWATAYSTQFELGPLSESSIGNVGIRKGSPGVVDHVMTPTGGMALMIAEDALDRYVIQRFEARTQSKRWRQVIRIALNPSRTFANVLAGKGWSSRTYRAVK